MPLRLSTLDGRVYDDAVPRFIRTGRGLAWDRITRRQIGESSLDGAEVGDLPDDYHGASVPGTPAPAGSIGALADLEMQMIQLAGGVAIADDAVTVTYRLASEPETLVEVTYAFSPPDSVEEIAGYLAAEFPAPVSATARGARVYIGLPDEESLLSLDASTTYAFEPPEEGGGGEPVAVVAVAGPVPAAGAGVTSVAFTFSGGGAGAPEGGASVNFVTDVGSDIVPDVSLPAGTDAAAAATLILNAINAVGRTDIAASLDGLVLTIATAGAATEITFAIVITEDLSED
ncbi:MAG: hypothetical protein ACE37J_12240 [Pikeienuella sp.]|uniref:hypothetical protein n=1 Tax=Pikeienuella sp. TaxID=2831957 RepID=UPI00391ABAF6